MLSNEQKKKLRSLAHQEKAIVMVGKHGLTETVLESFENALISHNLVKVNVLKTSPISAKEVSEKLSEDFSSEVISVVGRVTVLYRYSKKGRIIV